MSTPTPVPAETPEERELRENKEKIAALEAKATEDAKKAEDELAKAKTQRLWILGALIVLFIGAVITFVVIANNNADAISTAEAEKAKAVEVAEKAAAEAQAEVERKLAEAKAEAENAKVESERKLAEIKAEAEKAAAEAKAEVERKLAEAQEKAAADMETMREEMKKMAVTATTPPPVAPVVNPTVPNTPSGYTTGIGFLNGKPITKFSAIAENEIKEAESYLEGDDIASLRQAFAGYTTPRNHPEYGTIRFALVKGPSDPHPRFLAMPQAPPADLLPQGFNSWVKDGPYWAAAQ